MCESVVDVAPGQIDLRGELANSYRFLGVVLGDLRRVEEAEQAYRRSIPHYRRLASTFPSAPQYRHHLSMSQNSLGLLLQRSNRLQEAEEEFRAAIEFQQGLVDRFPSAPAYLQSLARSRHNLGNVMVERGLGADAERDLRLSLAVHKQLMDQEPAVTEHKSSYGATLHDLALCVKERKELVEARQLLEQAVRYQREAYATAPKHPSYGQYLTKHFWQLAHVNLELGTHPQAADAAREYSLVLPEDAGNAASAAEVTAWCITVVGKDSQLSAEAKRQRTDEYAARSMSLLTEAIRRGYDNVGALKRSKAFDPMRDRPDFKKLLADLEAKARGTP
jgi:tetratricopeptide (TPR) repeat protein